MQNDKLPDNPLLLAFVGMPGSGKSEATLYLKEKGYAYIRFGQLTEEGVKEMGLEVTPENEQIFREKIRQELGMAAYAIRSEEKIRSLLAAHDVVVIDGLYSWEEYVFLLQKFPILKIIYVYAKPSIRYERLIKRAVRPLSFEQARKRDFSEIEKLNKSGPIAMADYIIENNGKLEELYEKIEKCMTQFRVAL